ncbi:hypothetical protein L208DRAFT_1293749, partial [Tricholoma matsutake]
TVKPVLTHTVWWTARGMGYWRLWASYSLLKQANTHNLSNKSTVLGKSQVWIMGYQRLMGYGVEFPAHRLGGPKKVCDFGVYGLSKVWVKTGSTVQFQL